MAQCVICSKGPVFGNNVPNSVHKTRRRIQPNVQTVHGVRMCTRCLRTIKKFRAA
jgi:large subunit ribosomal protein L28